MAGMAGAPGGDRFVYVNPDGGARFFPNELDWGFIPEVFGSGGPNETHYINFDETTDRALVLDVTGRRRHLPSAVKVTLTVTDTGERDLRAFSRIFWIPTANPRP